VTQSGPSASCDEGHCVTCADEAVRMLVLEADGAGLARCEAPDGAHTEVMTDLVGDVAPGDALLVHAGTALARAA